MCKIITKKEKKTTNKNQKTDFQNHKSKSKLEDVKHLHLRLWFARDIWRYRNVFWL